MTAQAQTAAPRTRTRTLRDLDYLIRLNQRHRRLYARLSGGIRFLELVAAAFGFATAFGSPPVFLGIGGAALALASMAGFAFAPSLRHAAYDLALGRYSRLRAVAAGTPDMPLDELDRRMGSIEDPDYIESLRIPSFNDMMRSHGLDTFLQPVTRWQRLCAALA